jgi:D-glycero-D-manno-heptose 1,7-bisphosphate phosphatase
MMNKALFLDRDGIINQKAPEQDYIKSWREFKILPNVPEAIKLAKDHSWLIIAISNQRGIARGLMSKKTVDSIHRRLNEELEKIGTGIDRFYYCPHNYNECQCRKPAPGLVLEAIKDFSIDPSKSWLIGDSESDRLCGERAGVKTKIIPVDGSLLEAIKEIV